MKIPLLSVLVLAYGMAGCQKEEGINLELGRDIVVSHAQKVSINLSEGSGELRVNINDSRCPANAFCVVAGQATVRAQLQAGADSSRTVNLCLGGCYGAEYRFKLRDSAAVTLKGQDYWLHLLAVNPYPGTSQNDNATKTATMRLTVR